MSHHGAYPFIWSPPARITSLCHDPDLFYYNDALEVVSDWVLWKNSVNDGLSQRLATTSIDRLEDENWTPRTTR